MPSDPMIATFDGLLKHITPTHPLDFRDTIAVWDLLQPHMTRGYKLDIMHDKEAIHVRVYDARGLQVFTRELLAK